MYHQKGFRMRLTTELLVKQLQEGVKNFSNLRIEGLELVNFELQGVNFRGSDLTGANLSNSNLSNSNFKGCKITWNYIRKYKIKSSKFDTS